MIRTRLPFQYTLFLDAYGKYADFLVLKNDPLKDVSAVEQADKQVYQHGKRKY